jgi:CspA family cold shock protein
MIRAETGIVKSYDKDEGCGFILCDCGREVYVHYSAIKCEESECELEEGNRVRFALAQGLRGLQAQDVIVLTNNSQHTDLTN